MTVEFVATVLRPGTEPVDVKIYCNVRRRWARVIVSRPSGKRRCSACGREVGVVA